MPAPKILVVPGTIRPESINGRLAALAAKELTMADAAVTLISLADYPLPLLEADPDAKVEMPPNVLKLKRMVEAHDGIFIATPEHNAAMAPLVHNAVAWLARTRERLDQSDNVFRRRAFALGAATHDPLGGVHALIALRQVLEIGCGALVIPEQISLGAADQAFDDMDNLKDERHAGALRAAARRLVELSWQRIGA